MSTTITPLDQCDVLVTNTEVESEAQQVLSEHVGALMLAADDGSLEQAG